LSKYKVSGEHQLRSLVFDDYFKSKGIAWEQEIEKIDFIVTEKRGVKNKGGGSERHYLWMETKKSPTDKYIMLTQLLLTIKTPYDNNMYIIPNYVGCFDNEKIIFVPTNLITGILHDSDVKWNIAPNDSKNEYFLKLNNKLKYAIFNNKEVKEFQFGTQDEEIKNFIKENILKGETENKFEITEHNFDRIYLKWAEKVKPSILVNWDEEKKNGLLDGDFYLADLLSRDDLSIKNRLLIVLQNNYYQITKMVKKTKFLPDDDKYFFKDKQKAYNEFWSIYKRPPSDIYWENIINRKDLLVPQDIRERKGSFFTPQIWVELSQKYIADVLGDDWQDKYYVWDCCAGTGNLLVGINRKMENVFASTIDSSDVKAMYDRIDNGARLLKKNVFQFDFLNDDFKKLPKALKDIIEDKEKRKKLIIYINPPYAEATTSKTTTGTGENKPGVSIENKTNIKYKNILKKAGNELFANFFIRIYNEIPNCYLASFSTLKYVNSQNFIPFREHFLAEYKKGFICPADTFDNVNGIFPIGFLIWKTSKKVNINSINVDIYNKYGENEGGKNIYCNNDETSINKWIKKYENNNKNVIGYLPNPAPDVQNNKYLFITNNKGTRHVYYVKINYNIIPVSVYYTVRHCIKDNWINDRDQFLFPNKKWEKDTDFRNNCLIYTLFHDSNNIRSKEGTNHWIPFTEKEVSAKGKFASHFMSDFIAGKSKIKKDKELFDDDDDKEKGKLVLSKEAQEVFNAGKEIWKYYHSFSRVNVNASFYDIKLHFQESTNGRMNNKSTDEEYNTLIGTLREKLKILAKKIEPKIYKYGFLLK
jgi:16S rRNA G966 N2-methylase RsmD